jgi:hypothetical protein
MIQTIRKFGERDEAALPISVARDINVSLVVSIRADIHRILYALSIPEYMEVWADVPSFDRLCVEEDPSKTDFRVDLLYSDSIQCSIQCRRLLMTPDHLKYTWRKSDSEINKPTVVDMRIKRDKMTCIVSIRHTGLASESDVVWYSELWRCSLEKLRRVLEA